MRYRTFSCATKRGADRRLTAATKSLLVNGCAKALCAFQRDLRGRASQALNYRDFVMCPFQSDGSHNFCMKKIPFRFVNDSDYTKLSVRRRARWPPADPGDFVRNPQISAILSNFCTKNARKVLSPDRPAPATKNDLAADT